MKKIVVLVLLALLFTGCDPESHDKPNPSLPNHSLWIDMQPICSNQGNFGAWAWSWYKDGYEEGYGYAIRMTDAEWSQYCGQ